MADDTPAKASGGEGDGKGKGKEEGKDKGKEERRAEGFTPYGATKPAVAKAISNLATSAKGAAEAKEQAPAANIVNWPSLIRHT